MALVSECDCCGEAYPTASLVWIEYYMQNLCEVCINEVINSLEK